LNIVCDKLNSVLNKNASLTNRKNRKSDDKGRKHTAARVFNYEDEIDSDEPKLYNLIRYY
jgi:hypothetical protein